MTGGGWTDNRRPGNYDSQPYRSGEGQDAGRAGGSEAQIPQCQGCISHDHKVSLQHFNLCPYPFVNTAQYQHPKLNIEQQQLFDHKAGL